MMFTDASRILIDYQYLCARCCWQPNPSCILQQCILCVPSFCRAAGKESGESLLGKGGGLGRKPAASNVAEGYDVCIKLKLCRIAIVDFRAAAGDDRFSEGSLSLVVFPDSDYRGVYNPSGASLVLSKQTVGLHDGTLWYFIFVLFT